MDLYWATSAFRVVTRYIHEALSRACSISESLFTLFGHVQGCLLHWLRYRFIVGKYWSWAGNEADDIELFFKLTACVWHPVGSRM